MAHLYSDPHPNPEEMQYLDLLEELRDKLKDRGASSNRTAIKACKVIGRSMRFDLSNGKIPVFTTKKIHWKSVVAELLWFLSGDTNNETLRQQGVRIWNEWCCPEGMADRKGKPIPVGSLGPLYGQQWRRFPAGPFFRNMTWEELSAYMRHMAPDQRAILEAEASVPEPEGGIDIRIARDVLSEIGIDQISQALYLLKQSPNSRRIIVTAWNPQVVPSDNMSPQGNVQQGRAALAACHDRFQFVTEELTLEERIKLVEDDWRQHNAKLGVSFEGHVLADEKTIEGFRQANGNRYPTHRLSCHSTLRSQDTVLGTPFNVASYALLTHMVAKVVNMVPGELIWNGVDTHLYTNHLEAVDEQLRRTPYPFPTLELNPEVTDLFAFTLEDIKLKNYESHPPIKAEVAV